MADPLSTLRDRYAQPDFRAALAQHMQAMLQAPPANIAAPPPPQGPAMPNLSTQDFGRFRRFSGDYSPGSVGAQANYNTFGGQPAGWSAMLKYNSQF